MGDVFNVTQLIKACSSFLKKHPFYFNTNQVSLGYQALASIKKYQEFSKHEQEYLEFDRRLERCLVCTRNKTLLIIFHYNVFGQRYR